MHPLSLASLRRWARALKRETLVVWVVARDPRTPRLARWLALGVAAYALSPIDLIPDVIPVLGLLDDAILLPLGLWLVLRMVPDEVKDAARMRAQAMSDRPTSLAMAVAIVATWITAVAALVFWLWQ